LGQDLLFDVDDEAIEDDEDEVVAEDETDENH
jgi:hypothetical protein